MATMISPRAFAVSVFVLISTMLFAQSSPEAAPGIKLPESGSSVVVLDSVDGAPKLVPLKGEEVQFNVHAGANLARSFVYAGPHSGAEIAASASEITLASARPTIFVHLDSFSHDLQRERASLIVLFPAKTTREAGMFTANVFGKSRKRFVKDIPVHKSELEGSWLKMTLDEPLAPGEYGIAMIPKDPNGFSDEVYDFAIAPVKTH